MTFPAWPDGTADALEQDLLARWEQEALFARTQAATREGTPFVFYEGPPTANGRPGIHHVFARTIKDLVCRFRAMQGRSVTRIAGDGATVSVMGGVGGQGVYAIERPTRTLSSMLARAGGVVIEPEVAQITVTRGSHSGKVWLKDLYSNPAMDIALRPGDIILVEEDTRAFTALGATGAQNRVQFTSQTISALEAIAQVGGLNTGFADPKGVFVFRNEPADIANSVLGRSDLTGDQRMVYVLDLTEPTGMFNARDFVIRDGDTVYVTEAPYVQWQKTLAALTGTLGTANSVNSLATN